MNSQQRRPRRGDDEMCAYDTEEVLRRASECSAAYSESSDQDDANMNLRRDYENAVECLIQCESIIVSLEKQLASRDKRIVSLEEELEVNKSNEVAKEQLEAKDKHIANLEEKIVKMSLELASTKAREDRLQHQLKASFKSSFSSGGLSSGSLLSISESVQGRYRPSSKARRRRNARARWEEDDNDKDDQDHEDGADCEGKAKGCSTPVTASFVTASFTTAASSKPSFASFGSDVRLDQTAQQPGAGALSGLGNFIRKNWSWRDAQQPQGKEIRVEFPREPDDEAGQGGMKKNFSWRDSQFGGKEVQIEFPKRDGDAAGGMGAFGGLGRRRQTVDAAAVPGRIQLRRPDSAVPPAPVVSVPGLFQANVQPMPQRRSANPRRTAMMKSSRSFLENNGVVFPVSSFEVLNKGCLVPGADEDKERGTNEEWPEFR